MVQTQCQEWTRARDRDGYGVHGYPQERAHRTVYTWKYGPIPDGMVVRHKCDNPPCVNPDHLELGTYQDNARDRVARGRDSKRSQLMCKHGHEFDLVNTYITPDGRRQCRACRRERSARCYANLGN